MTRKICSIENCNRRAITRGWCQKHYARWTRHGDPNIVLTPGYGPGGRSKQRNIARGLKARGLTYQEIGNLLEVSRQRAQQLVTFTRKEAEQVKVKHNSECYFCHKRDGKLEFHHVTYTKNARVILLCASCHKKLDHINGPSIQLGV